MTKREKILVSIFIALLVLCVYFYGVKLIAQDIAILNAENENLTLQYEETEMKIELIDAYTEALASNEAELEIIKANIGGYCEDEELHVLFTNMVSSYTTAPVTLSISDSTSTYTGDEGTADGYFAAKEVIISFSASNANFMKLVEEMNSRGDTIILSASQSSNETDGDYTVECVVFMEDKN